MKPLPAGRWGYQAAAHLLNRAGFGGPPSEVEEMEARGLERVLEGWLTRTGREEERWERPEWAGPDPGRGERMREMRDASEEERRRWRREEALEQRRRVERVRAGWIQQMVTGSNPLLEKMVLFWHGHFATSVQKVRDAGLMWRQLDLFRRHGLGGWRELLLAVARDPAMLIWLDQARSRKGRPNENFARELLELFTLGEGNYREDDVREAARALTGLAYHPARQESIWRPWLHDQGEKTFLGRTGNLGLEEVMETIVEQPQADRFITGRLWAFFAGAEPERDFGEELAEVFRAGGRRIGPFLRVMFSAEAFYAPERVRTQIKSPVQWLVGAYRQMETRPSAGGREAWMLRELGQDLLAPPNVKGWAGGAAWINTSTWLRRQSLAAVLVLGREAMPDLAGDGQGARWRQRLEARARAGMGREMGVRVAGWFGSEERADRERFLAALARRFLQAPLRSTLETRVRRILEDAGEEMQDTAIRRAVTEVMQSTDYQLA